MRGQLLNVRGKSQLRKSTRTLLQRQSPRPDNDSSTARQKAGSPLLKEIQQFERAAVPRPAGEPPVANAQR